MVARRRALSNKVIQPDYAGLTGVVFHHRYEGLVTGTTNAAGVVDGSNNVTKIISMSPHVTGNEFDSNGTAPTLTADGILNGLTGRLRHNGASSVFNNFHHRATITDLKWAVHGVFKIGNSSNPNAAYGLFGNAAGSSANKGISFFYDDRAVNNTNNAFTFLIGKASAGVFITLASNTNIFTPNTFIDFWLQVDKSQIQENQVQLYINGFRFISSNRIDNNTTVTTPSFAMEIFGWGNGGASAIMTMKEITFQDALNTDAFRQQFITDRMFKYGIAAFPNVVDSIPISSDWNLVNTFDETRYYLTNHLCQKPSDPNVITSIFLDTVDHLFQTTRKVSYRKSLDKGRTWGAKGTVSDPAGTEAVGDVGAGVGSDGRLHCIYDTETSWTAGSTNKLYYTYSTDDGVTWQTPVDITSILPSDGLTAWRVYCHIIENNGVLMCVIYRFTAEGFDFTNSARTLLRSTNNGSSWTAIDIQTGSVYRNESAIIGLSSTVLLVVTRDEVTFEWYQSMSTDNGLTWSNQGALNFGESLASACPVRLRKFQIAGTDVVACYYLDRTNNLFKVIYGKVSDLIASGLTGWNLNTKFTIHQGSGEHLHYGDVCHYDGDFKGLAQYVIDTFPPTGGTQNEMYTIDVPTFQYPFVKSALGL